MRARPTNAALSAVVGHALRLYHPQLELIHGNSFDHETFRRRGRPAEASQQRLTAITNRPRSTGPAVDLRARQRCAQVHLAHIPHIV